jgi:hypothetical protein
MNCIMTDVDKDGDIDMVVPDRGVEICWYDNPGGEKVYGPWQRKTRHKHHEPMFMTIADVDGDQIDDFIITGGSKGALAGKLIVLLRANKHGDPAFHEIRIDQPCGNFPKGVAVLDLNGDPGRKEILVTRNRVISGPSPAPATPSKLAIGRPHRSGYPGRRRARRWTTPGSAMLTTMATWMF